MYAIILLQLARCSVFLAVLALLLVLLVRASRLKSAATLRTIWGASLLVSLFGFAIPISVPVTVEQETVHEAPVVPSMSQTFEPQLVGQRNSAMALTPSPVVDATPLPEMETPQPSTFAVTQTWFLRHWQTLLLAAWGIGVLVLLTQRLISHALLSVRLFRQIKPIDDATRKHWETLLAQYDFSRNAIPIRLTDSTGPAIIRSGFDFVLLIPETLWDELSPELRDGVLRHELGHLVHRDTLLSPLAHLLASLQWFNPAAWYALTRYNEATEWHADEFAYGTQNDSSSLLAETFLAIHRSTESQGLYLHSFSRFSTLDRINRLLNTEQSGKEHAMKNYVVGAVALLLLLAGTFRVEFVARAETEQVETSQKVETPPEPKPETAGATVSPSAPVAETQEEFRIHGRVFMPDGTPAKNAKIVSTGYVKTNTAYGFHTTTDQDGKYVISTPMQFMRCDAFTLQAYMSHYPEGKEPDPKNMFEVYNAREIIDPLLSEMKSFYREDRNTIECDFTLQEGFPLHGTVRYADGTPAKNAIVSMVPVKTPDIFKEKMSATFSRGTFTDEEGNYQIYLSPEEYKVSAIRGQKDQLVEIGPGKNPEVDLLLKNITLVRFVHADDTPLFQKKILTPLNLAHWEFGELDAFGKPKLLSVGSGWDTNENGDFEMCPEGKTYLLFTTDDFQEGYVGEIPAGLENFAVVNAKLVPTAKAKFRILDASEKPLIGKDVFCYVHVKHSLGQGSYNGLRVGDVIRTDDEGYITIPVPALGDFADRFKYELNVSLPENQDVKQRSKPEFTPALSNTVTDFGDVFLEGDFTAFEK